MQLEIITCPMSGPQGLYFPFAGTGYSMASYRAEYSGGAITEQDCRQLLEEINGNPLTNQNNCDKGLWLMLLNIVVMAVCMGVYVNLAAKETVSISSKSDLGTAIGLGYGLILGCGFVSLISNFCIMAKRQTERMEAKRKIANSITTKHNNNTFGPKQAVARMSTHGGYIAIQFLWVNQPAPAAMLQQAPLFGHQPQPLAPHNQFEQEHQAVKLEEITLNQ